MLILTRRVDEALHVGEGVTVRVLGVTGGQVRLGIDAPQEVRILREEVRDDLGSAVPRLPPDHHVRER